MLGKLINPELLKNVFIELSMQLTAYVEKALFCDIKTETAETLEREVGFGCQKMKKDDRIY